MVIPLLLVVAVLLIVGWRYWKGRHYRRAFQSVPTPPKHWLLGNIPQVLKAVKRKQFFQQLFDWSQLYGPVYCYWAGYPVLVLSKPVAIERAVIDGMRDGSLVRTQTACRAWNDISGPILLGQQGTEWQWRRKVWNPEFSTSGVARCWDVVHQACTQTVQQVKAASPTEPLKVDPLFVELTMRVIACVLLGIPVSKTPSPEGPPLNIQKLYEAMSVVSYRFLRVATGEKRWMKYLPTQSAREYWAARHYFEDFLGPRIDLALKLRDQQPVEVSSGFQNSMLVKIAAKEPRYTRETLISESIELLIAGTDTTAHTLSFAVGELALNPAVCQKAQAVVDQVWQQHDGLTPDSLKDLAYVQAIVKETLRLYSVASGSTSLQATRETVVEGVTLPKGAKVYWSMLAAGRDADLYPQPEEFQPDRWLSDEGSHALPFIDFGSGAHRCLGEHLAMLTATNMLALLLRHFSWELVNGHASLENLKQNLLIYPPDGVPLRFQLRRAPQSLTR